jgi:hypothetical protein
MARTKSSTISDTAVTHRYLGKVLDKAETPANADAHCRWSCIKYRVRRGDACQTRNESRGLEHVQALPLAINSAEDERNPPELGFDLDARAREWRPSRTIQPVSDDVPQNEDESGDCEAPGCTNSGGAFTSERDGRIYEFCSEACRAAFERPAA